jgi:hypothetical protein
MTPRRQGGVDFGGGRTRGSGRFAVTVNTRMTRAHIQEGVVYSKYVRDLFLKLRVRNTPLPAICLIVLLAITWLTADSGGRDA